MFFIAIIGINVAVIAIWSVRNKQNGFAEIPKLLRGEPSFIPTGIYPVDSGDSKPAYKDPEAKTEPDSNGGTYTPT